MALEKWRKWRKSGIDPFGRYGQPDLPPHRAVLGCPMPTLWARARVLPVTEAGPASLSSPIREAEMNDMLAH
jgi:hypothetical protein